MLQELPKNPRIFLLFHFTGYSRGGMHILLTFLLTFLMDTKDEKKKPSIPHKGPKGFGGTTLISTVPKCLHTARSSSDNAGKNAVLQLHGAPRPVP